MIPSNRRGAANLSMSDGDALDRLDYLTRVSKDLSSERNINRLLETILDAAQNITNADGGTVCRVTPENNLYLKSFV